MSAMQKLKAVRPQPGRPLYTTVRDVVREAIDAGMFRPGQQMPSTKWLAARLGVSLVTAHRALQELVARGIIQRSQGRGTFVHERYRDRSSARSAMRLGLIFPSSASLADHIYCETLDGVHRAVEQLALDLVLLPVGDDVRNECQGLLLINPRIEQIDALVRQPQRKPACVVGAPSPVCHVSSSSIDAAHIGRLVVQHLADLQHTSVGFVGGDDQIAGAAKLWDGFLDACHDSPMTVLEQHVIRSLGGHLDARERLAVVRMLCNEPRPTAIFAAGTRYVLDVYDAAKQARLSVPRDLSIIGLDDPPAAAHLSPALTTVRQPLAQLGYNAVLDLVAQIRTEPPPLQPAVAEIELIVRKSTASPMQPMPAVGCLTARNIQSHVS